MTVKCKPTLITAAAAGGVLLAVLLMLTLGRRLGAITLLVVGLMLGFTAQGLTSVLLHFAARVGGRVYRGWSDASFAGVAPESLPWLVAPMKGSVVSPEPTTATTFRFSVSGSISLANTPGKVETR